MTVTVLQTPEQLEQYDQWVREHPQGNLWQSLAWKQYQESLGRKTRIYASLEGSQIIASALVVIDRTVGGFSTWDVPRGPLLKEKEESHKWETYQTLMEQIREDARKDQCISLFLSPHYPLPTNNYSRSPRHEQPEATRILDLTVSKEELLAQMHPKGRYNIKVAEKHGIHIKESKDIDAYHALAQSTARRDGFRIPSKRQLEAFLNLKGSFLLLAYTSAPTHYSLPTTHSPPIAGLLGVIWRNTGIYYYGASDHASRALMAPYLLQWEAMKYCKAQGCIQYDLLGIAPTTNSTHPWSGISAFKEKFGGQVVQYAPEQMITLRPLTAFALKIKRSMFG